MSAFPEFFGEGDETMFGWFHPAASGTDRGTAVVLCPPLGFDYICAYRSWRILAERLAAAGFGVLRFDYLNTGDSAGDATAPHQVAQWQRSVGLAAAHARARTGATFLALVGFRLGATLATCAAPGIEGVDSLVLWSPFSSGRSYAREVTALARLSRSEAVDASGEVEAAGFLMTRATLDELSGLDLLALREPPAPRVLLFEREGFSPDGRLPAHLSELGCAVTVECAPGTPEVLVQPMTSRVPEIILERIVAWLVERHPLRRGGRPFSIPTSAGRRAGRRLA